MKLTPPIANFNWKSNITQLFGVSRETYSQFNIPGHNGIDLVVKDGTNMGYGTPILASHDGVVISVSHDLSRSKGAGVVLQTQDGQIVVQTTYWHLSSVSVQVGNFVKQGQVVGLMGNSGYVFPEPSSMCSRCGTHLHFAVATFKNSRPVFTEYGDKGYQDPVPFLYNTGDKLPLILNKDLFSLRRDDEVAWLQTCLNLEGLAQDYTPTGMYGPKTLRDVRQLQTKYGLTPAVGFTGPKTRELLNRKYSAYVN